MARAIHISGPLQSVSHNANARKILGIAGILRGQAGFGSARAPNRTQKLKDVIKGRKQEFRRSNERKKKNWKGRRENRPSPRALFFKAPDSPLPYQLCGSRSARRVSFTARFFRNTVDLLLRFRSSCNCSEPSRSVCGGRVEATAR